MHNPLSHDLAAALRDDLARASNEPRRRMRHELRYAGKPGRRVRRRRS
jgi:hypothetical protein